MRQIIYLAILRLSTLKDCQYWLSNNNSYLTSDMEISPIFFLRDTQPWSGIAMISTLNQSSYHLLKASFN